MAITALPTIPQRLVTPDALFAAQVGAFLGALPQFASEVNAVATSLNLVSTTSNSTTSLAVGTGTKTLTVDASKSYVPGQTVKIAYTTDPSNWMLGDVFSYNVVTGLLVVAVQFKQGSGTYALWTISLSAPVPATIPAGSKTVWFQATAPVGWTQDTTHDNKALRVVGGAGAGTGGSVAFTAAFASKAVTGTNSATTLTKAMIPTHVHSYVPYQIGGGLGNGGSAPGSGPGAATNTGDGSADGVGGGSAHTHPFTGTAINLAVQYIDMIMATKD